MKTTKHMMFLWCVSSLCQPVWAGQIPALPETPMKVFHVSDGKVVIPALDDRNLDILNRSVLRGDPDVSYEFPNSFFDYEGIAPDATVWIFAKESGQAFSVKRSDLKWDPPDFKKTLSDVRVFNFHTGLPNGVCPGYDCVAVVADKNPFAGPVSDAVEFSNPPGTLSTKTFGIDESLYDAARLHYAKLPGGAEIVFVETFKKGPNVVCEQEGIIVEVVGYVRVGKTWHKTPTSLDGNELFDLSPAALVKRARPSVITGRTATGDEVLLWDSRFIFVGKTSASQVLISSYDPGVCAC